MHKEYLWDCMFSDKGLKTWLGNLKEALEIKKSFTTKEGTVKISTPFCRPWRALKLLGVLANKIKVRGIKYALRAFC